MLRQSVDLDLALRSLRSLKFFLEAGQNSFQDACRACRHDAEQRSAQSVQVFSGRSSELSGRLDRNVRGRGIVASGTIGTGRRPLRMNFRRSSQRAEQRREHYAAAECDREHGSWAFFNLRAPIDYRFRPLLQLDQVIAELTSPLRDFPLYLICCLAHCASSSKVRIVFSGIKFARFNFAVPAPTKIPATTVTTPPTINAASQPAMTNDIAYTAARSKNPSPKSAKAKPAPNVAPGPAAFCAPSFSSVFASRNSAWTSCARLVAMSSNTSGTDRCIRGAFISSLLPDSEFVNRDEGYAPRGSPTPPRRPTKVRDNVLRCPVNPLPCLSGPSRGCSPRRLEVCPQ